MIIKNNLDDSIKLRLLSNKDIVSGFGSSGITRIVETLEENARIQILHNKEFIKEHGLSNFYICKIITTLSDENKQTVISDKNFIEQELHLGQYDILKIVESLGDNAKIQILYNQDFIQEYGIDNFQIQKIVETLSDEGKQKILYDKDFIEQQLHLEGYQILGLIYSIENEKIKLEMIDFYKIKNLEIVGILNTFSDKGKMDIILENRYNFNNDEMKKVISTFGVDSLVDFIGNSKEFLSQNGISPYEITSAIDKEKQVEFVSKFEQMDFSLQEKRQILSTLSKEAKSDIDTTKFSPECLTAIEMQTYDEPSNTNSYGKIKIDSNQDLEIYRGLDELIYINPVEMSSEDKSRLLELCEICPNISIHDNIGLCPSTAEEYRNGEIWIESVLQGINAEWSNIQKVAFIDNAIGKKISYTPDCETEVFNDNEARALWKIIHSGYGVCNGIAQVEKYILSKVGIDAEMVSSDTHSFIKLNGIEIPNTEGGVTMGDTIIDPTWNLAANRYGAKPQNFCISYEAIREHDITSDGTDLECHKNDEKLASATLELDDQSLRGIFTSIGLADENGNFPLKELKSNSKAIDDCRLPHSEAMKRQLSLIAQYCPEFATCQNSTTKVLSSILLNQENLQFNKCVVNRVYEKNDINRKPVLYVYADLPGEGKKFYFADDETRQFLEMPQKEFEARFECYAMDMAKQHLQRPWEDAERTKNSEELTQSSGNVNVVERDEK